MDKATERWLIDTYEAVFDPEGFLEQFQKLAAMHDSPICALHVEGPGLKDIGFTAGVDIEQVARDYPQFDNLWIERGTGDLLARGVTHDGWHTPLEEMERTDYHRYLLKPLDIDHSIGALCDLQSSGVFTMLSISRSRRVGAYQDTDVATLQALRPHLQAITRLYTRAREQDNHAAGLQALLDQERTPRLKLDASLRIEAANRAALRLLEDGDLLRVLSNGQLAASTLGAQRLTTAAQSDAPFEMMLTSPDGDRRALLNADPLQPARQRGHTAQVSYLISITLLRQPLEGPDRRLMNLFELTQREADLAHALARHFTLPAAAEDAGMKHETARSHLKRCFDKTRTRSQAELVALLRDLLRESS